MRSTAFSTFLAGVIGSPSLEPDYAPPRHGGNRFRATQDVEFREDALNAVQNVVAIAHNRRPNLALSVFGHIGLRQLRVEPQSIRRILIGYHYSNLRPAPHMTFNCQSTIHLIYPLPNPEQAQTIVLRRDVESAHSL